MVSFTLTPEQLALKDAARAFAQGHLRNLVTAQAAETDPLARALLARPVVEEAVRAGFLKGFVPEAAGGAAGGGIEAAILVEEWAVESPDFVITLAGPLIALMPLYEAGTPEQVARFVAPFLADEGAPLAAMAFSEPGGTANFAAASPGGTQTTAVPDGAHYVVNGRKAWASTLSGWDGNGPDVMTIVCRAPGGVSLLVATPNELAGHIEVEEHYDLPGLRGCLTSRIALHDVRIPRSHLIGTEGDGVALTRNAFIPSGASIGVFATAAMRRAFEHAHRFATTDTRGGAVPVIEHQAVADLLSDSKGRLEATRLLAWRALDAVMSQDPSAAEWALHSKVLGSETGLQVVTDLAKAVGMASYDLNHPLHRALQDALAYPIIEGGNVGVRRRQLQELLAAEGYEPLAASGLV
ncbi:acyl-CoA dehydrogenase family protein [Nocardioides bruguierae]|uniref:Acyl-CoA dehydrogenase family protein n=1 Tax=Nocardioides bruguierae TaxID=2945102 RepID=A0A9X2DA96_9ACTN|nr:acyl-CoA dehydrogenase family protein [Nocardioides bruguierae]MCM0620879.1 acyl-CoA dehydrogenase family protein [Nocardioides bruguierae]